MDAESYDGQELVVRQTGGETEDLPFVLPGDLKIQQFDPCDELLDQFLREGFSLEVGVHDSYQLIMSEER